MNNTQLSDKNTGISLLRLFMCFVVVLDHFGRGGGTTLDRFLNLFGNLAVPCFMFISFYLTAGLFQDRNIVVLKKRIKRLLYPLIFWTLVYYIIFSVIRGSFLDWRHIFYSVLFGTSSILVPPLWFISAQILVVFIFFIVSCLTTGNNKKIQIAYITIIIISFIFQYTGINYYLFSNAVFESKWTLGRIVEVLPIAATGFLYAINEQKIRHKKLIFLCLVGLIFITKGLVPLKDFQYSGMSTYFRALLICFLFVNFSQIKCRCLASIINYTSQYTMGMYCLHYLVGKYMYVVLEFLHINLYISCLLYNILIYISSFLISIIIDFFSVKIKRFRMLGSFVK